MSVVVMILGGLSAIFAMLWALAGALTDDKQNETLYLVRALFHGAIAALLFYGR